MEVGVSESYAELKRDAWDWLWGSDDLVKLVILLKLTKPSSQSQDDTPPHTGWSAFLELWERSVPGTSTPFSPPDTYITEPAHVYRMPILLGQQISANNYIFLLAWPEIHLICLDISLAMDIRYEEPLWPGNVILVHRVGHEHRM